MKNLAFSDHLCLLPKLKQQHKDPQPWGRIFGVNFGIQGPTCGALGLTDGTWPFACSSHAAIAVVGGGANLLLGDLIHPQLEMPLDIYNVYIYIYVCILLHG